ncbi:hypothetical protein D3C87_1862240 [compost metagenome]
MQTSQNIGQNVDRIGGGATKQAGVQVAICGGDDDFLANKATQCPGYSRCFLVPHAGIADESKLGLQFSCIGFKEWFEGWGAGFFFAFKKNGHTDRQRTVNVLVGPACLNKGHQLALVI